MGPLNNIPKGLLTLLGLQTLGEYPAEFAETVAGTFNVRDLIEVQAQGSAAFTLSYTGGPGIGTSGYQAFQSVAANFNPAPSFLRVPQTEHWFWRRWSLTLTLHGTQGSIPMFTFVVNRPGLGGWQYMAPPHRRAGDIGPYTGSATGNGRVIYQASSAEPFFMKPGDFFGVCPDNDVNLAVAGFDVVLDADIIVLRS